MLSNLKIQCHHCLRERVTLREHMQLGGICPACNKYIVIDFENVPLDELIKAIINLETGPV